jgi:hypothetical protein
MPARRSSAEDIISSLDPFSTETTHPFKFLMATPMVNSSFGPSQEGESVITPTTPILPEHGIEDDNENSQL